MMNDKSMNEFIKLHSDRDGRITIGNILSESMLTASHFIE